LIKQLLHHSAVMVAGAIGYRVPPQDSAPEGFTPAAAAKNARVAHVHLDVAWETPQFWLLPEGTFVDRPRQMCVILQIDYTHVRLPTSG
jgi:hypothetical protein